MMRWLFCLTCIVISTSNAMAEVSSAPVSTRPEHSELNLDAVPLPDLQTPVDYVTWYRSLLPPKQENAYYDYDPLFTDPDADFPRDLFNDRYNSDGDFGPPAPWSPAQQPAWEESRQETADLVQRFAAATRSEKRYTFPVNTSNDPNGSKPLLVSVLAHITSTRLTTLSKSVIAQAWRMENDRVDPEKMRQAWRTVLANAQHLHQDLLLFSQLKGRFHTRLVEENARWALHCKVFDTPDQIEKTLHLLREHDLSVKNPGKVIPIEYAVALEKLQMIYRATPGELEESLHDELKDLDTECFTLSWSKQEIRQLIATRNRLPMDQIAIRLRKHYQDLAPQCGSGYPAFTADDFGFHEIFNKEDEILERFFLNLGPYHKLMTNGEASRRATQLAYAVELYQRQNGHYPETLQDLPVEYGREMILDPFSDQPFKYNLTAQGPVIYSVGPNNTDDGGIHSPNWSTTEEQPSDDHIFYPPQWKP